MKGRVCKVEGKIETNPFSGHVMFEMSMTSASGCIFKIPLALWGLSTEHERDRRWRSGKVAIFLGTV